MPAPNEQSPSARPRLKALTPELRRFLDKPRGDEGPLPEDEKTELVSEKAPRAPEPISETRAAEASEESSSPAPEHRRLTQSNVSAQAEAARAVEMRHALAVIALLVVLGIIFYAGTKFDRLKYEIMTRLHPPKLENAPERFPGMNAEELVDSGIEAEKRGDWNGAAERFIEAKHKDLNYRGLLFRVGKNSYDRDNLQAADQALARAIEFGEDVPAASYLRAVIAVRRRDFAAASRLFEAATKAQPFTSPYFYYWAEELRLDQKPAEAIHRYEQALKRTPNPQDVVACQFKIRMASIEAARAAEIAKEVEEMRKVGPLTIDWLMTDAALQVQAGEISKAAQLISQAKEKGASGLFQVCAGDTIFVKAAESHQEIAALIKPAPAP